MKPEELLGLLSPEARGLLSGEALKDCSGHSCAQVFFDAPAGLYIKTDEAGALEEEARLGRLFYQMGLGPELLRYESGERDILMSRQARGLPLTKCLKEPEALCAMLAESLKKLHALPPAGFPLSSRLKRYRESAAGDFEGGYYDESVLMQRYPIKDKAEAWRIMQREGGMLEADCLIHGDACLPNILQQAGHFSAFIDLAMAGAGDRHIDLYWALWSLAYNLKTEAYGDLFLDLYGREKVSEEKLQVVAAFELFG